MLISTHGSNHRHRWFWLLSQSTVLLLLLLLLYSGFSDQHPVQQQQSQPQPQPQQGQRQSHQFESSTLQNSAAQLSRLNDVEIVDNVDNRVPYYQQPNNIIVNHNNHNDPDDGNLPEHFDERRRDIPAGNSSDCVKQVLIVDTSVINNPTNLINRRVPLVSSQSQQFQPQVAPPRQLPQSHQAVQSGHPTPQVQPIYIQTVPPQHPQIGLTQGHQQQPMNVSHSTSSTTIQVQINSSSTTSTTTIQPQRPNVLMPKLESTGRPACVESPDDTFCEIVDNYPKAAIKSEINFSPEQFGEIFGSKEIDGRKSYSDDDMGEEGVCRKFPKVIYPQMAKNQANQWVYVVNEVEYTQAVVAEVCEKQGKACAYLDQNLPPGMYSRCKQKYSYKRLLALHPTEKRTYPDAFKFPSCCSCYVKFDDFARSGLGRKLQSQVPVVDTSAKRQSPSPDNHQQNNSDTVDRNQNQSPIESTLVFNIRNQEQPSEVQPHRNQTSTTTTTRRRHRTSTLQPTIPEQSYTTTAGTRTRTKQFDP